MSDRVRQLLEEAEKIIVGISGGADSVALTHILFSLYGADKLLAAHVNHGIRGKESYRDEVFVQNFCSDLGIPLKVRRVDVPARAKEMGLGEEACGRALRYEFFSSLCGKGDVVATAHNADDHAETVLLNLVRGSGLQGLRGIPQVRGNIVRPILSMSRAQVEDYCSREGLRFVNDSTNGQNDYARNRLRNQVMPILQGINSAAVQNIGRAAKRADEAAEYLERRSVELLKAACGPYGLRTNALKDEEEVLLCQLLQSYLKASGCSGAEEGHIKRLCAAVKGSGGVSLPGGFQADVRQGLLTVTQKKWPELRDCLVQVGGKTHIGSKILQISKEKLKNGPKINKLLFNNAFDCDKIKGVLVAGPRRQGDNFSPAGRGVRKSLKKLLNEKQIPAALRDCLLVLRDEKEIVFIEGIGVSETHRVRADSQIVGTVEIKAIGDE